MTRSEMKTVQKEPPAAQQEPDRKRSIALKPLPASIRIDVFGDLMKFTKKAQQTISFRKFDQLALFLAQRTRDERLLIYRIFCGLSLTAHARRTQDASERKQIFDLKNKLFLSIANDNSLRRMVNLRLGVSKRFKVTEYCSACKEKNTEENLSQRDWKFCQKCKIDRNYYNIISLQHRFDEGSGTLFLGQEHVEELHFGKLLKRIPLNKMEEELSFAKYKFTPKTLISIELESLKSCTQKLIDLAKKTNGPLPAPRPANPTPVKR